MGRSPTRDIPHEPVGVDALEISGTDIAELGGGVSIAFLPGKRYLGNYTEPNGATCTIKGPAERCS